MTAHIRLAPTRTVVLNQSKPDAMRREIRSYFHASYDIEEALLSTLTEPAFFKRADPLRHPLIFYYGHTATFYVNKLIVAGLINDRIDPKFESMFAVGVDEMSWDDLNVAHYNWPAVDEVAHYRRRVRELVDGLIATMPLTPSIDWSNPWWAIVMGIEHSRIHLETSSVLIRQLPDADLIDHPQWAICPDAGEPPANELVAVGGGSVALGKAKDHPLYGWDNEFGTHRAEVAEFNASKYLVSNREYLGFVDDGGYRNDAWWTDEGCRWRDYRKATHPPFWIDEGGGSWRLRTMLREIAMPWNWPVEVNCLEAKAFCNWLAGRTGKTLRLPTEDEWRRLRDAGGVPDQPYWQKAPGNINLEYWASPCPVDRFGFGEVYDIIGNVWQWTETPIYAFEGFDAHPYYDDFSTPTFDNLHNLIKGGSWISTGNEATADSRYAFRRHFFQHAGLRYVETEAPVVVHEAAVYESDRAVAQYCELHYGEEYFGVPNYPKRLAGFCVERMEGRPMRKALDIGCAVGRATFELARAFDEVMGLDFSARFIRRGAQMAEQGFVRYERIEEGEIVSIHERHLAEFGLTASAARVAFRQADACNLKPLYTGYDLVLAANLIDRLYNPRKFLQEIGGRITQGGLLVLASPYTWDPAFTDREAWLGGYRKDGEPYYTLDALRNTLNGEFAPEGPPTDTPFVLRETARKYQHTVAQVTVWRKR